MIDIQARRWHRLRPLLEHAIDLKDKARCAYLDALHGEDAELHDDLEHLLAEHDRLVSRSLPNAIELVTCAIVGEFGKEATIDDEIAARVRVDDGFDPCG